MHDCTPEIKTCIAPDLPKEDNKLIYQSYTAMSVKYPETPIEIESDKKETFTPAIDNKVSILVI